MGAVLRLDHFPYERLCSRRGQVVQEHWIWQRNHFGLMQKL